MGGGGDSRPVVRGPMAVALPRTLPRPFWRATAGYVDRPQAAMGSRYRLGTAPDLAGNHPSPHSRPCRRSNSDHAGESTYSGEIESLNRDPGIVTLVPGMRFPGN